jgi:DNA-binding transcriptional LysR family regulator
MNAQKSHRRVYRGAFPWDDLNTVLAVARAGSLSAAARVLGVNHSTVSRRIAALEKATGHTLFRRLARGYVPTAAGEELVAAAERMEAEVQRLARLLSGQDISLGGTVRLTAPDDMANHLLPDSLARFNETAPGVAIEMLIDNRLLNLTRREADIALRATRSPPERLVGRRIAELDAAVYARRDRIPRLGGAASEPEALRAHPWVAWEEDNETNVLKSWVMRYSAPERVVYRSNSVANQFAAVRAGLGLGALPCYLGDGAPELARVLPPEEAMATGLWILTRPDLKRAARIAALTEFLAADLAAVLKGREARPI